MEHELANSPDLLSSNIIMNTKSRHMVNSQIKYMKSHKMSAKDKFLTDQDFIETQIKIEEIYEEKQRRLELIKKSQEKLNMKFKMEDLEKKKEAELQEFLKKERAVHKREEIKKRMHQRRLDKLKREEYLKNRNHSQSAPARKPLYVQIEEKFANDFERPLIEERQKKLEEIRNSRITPINHKRIKKHKKEYLKCLKLMADERMKKRAESESTRLAYNPEKLENYFSKLVKKLDSEKAHELKEKLQIQKRRVEAKDQFKGFNIFTLKKMFINKE